MLGTLTAAQVEDVLRGETICRIGCHAEGRTYVVPLCYAYDGQAFWCHTSDGLKISMLRQDRRACVEVEHVDDLSNWRSVIAWGRFEELEGEVAERGFQLLLDRFTPIFAAGKPAGPAPSLHAQATHAHRTDQAGRPTVVFRISLEEKFGRFERRSEGAMEPPRAPGLFDAIHGRRSVRSYREDRVDEATIRRLLDAAVQAPTAVHAEPWAFVVVQDRNTLRRLSDRAKALWSQDSARKPGTSGGAATSRYRERLADPEFNIFYDASTLIVICARPLGRYVTADCWLAAENLMLAAYGLGLGTCCIGFALPVLNVPEVKDELRIPSEVSAVAAIILGVPRGPTPLVPRKTPEILSWT